MTLTENGNRVAAGLHAHRMTGELLSECDRIRTLNAIYQVAAARKVAPQLEKGLKDARDALAGLLNLVNELKQENKQLKADRVPGQFTDRVVNIQGREGFKWQVML